MLIASNKVHGKNIEFLPIKTMSKKARRNDRTSCTHRKYIKKLRQSSVEICLYFRVDISTQHRIEVNSKWYVNSDNVRNCCCCGYQKIKVSLTYTSLKKKKEEGTNAALGIKKKFSILFIGHSNQQSALIEIV